MSIQICNECGDRVDTDYNAEHFNENGVCEESISEDQTEIGDFIKTN